MVSLPPPRNPLPLTFRTVCLILRAGPRLPSQFGAFHAMVILKRGPGQMLPVA